MCGFQLAKKHSNPSSHFRRYQSYVLKTISLFTYDPLLDMCCEHSPNTEQFHCALPEQLKNCFGSWYETANCSAGNCKQ